MYSNTFIQCKDGFPIPTFSHIALDDLDTSFRVFRLDVGEASYQFSMTNKQYVDFLIELGSAITAEAEKHRLDSGSAKDEQA